MQSLIYSIFLIIFFCLTNYINAKFCRFTPGVWNVFVFIFWCLWLFSLLKFTKIKNLFKRYLKLLTKNKFLDTFSGFVFLIPWRIKHRRAEISFCGSEKKLFLWQAHLSQTGPFRFLMKDWTDISTWWLIVNVIQTSYFTFGIPAQLKYVTTVTTLIIRCIL